MRRVRSRLVRASAGLSGMWRYPDREGSFSDAITVYPDHLAPRYNAAAIAALLVRRERTGRGGRVSTAQVDAIFAAMADRLALESLEPGSVTAEGDPPADAPAGLFACAGDDEWLVIDGAGDERFRALATVIDRPEWLSDAALATTAGRLGRAAELRAAVSEWATAQDAVQAEAALQAAGVPAGHMVRVEGLLGDEHLQSRPFFGELHHPHLGVPLPTLLGEAAFEHLPDVELHPAPVQAEHTYEVLEEYLGLDAAAVEKLVADGVAEVSLDHQPAPPGEESPVR